MESATVNAIEVVLVHGLYHQPAHLQPLVDELRVRGARMQVPRLHRGSLDADTEMVQAAVRNCKKPPVVVGHSYGGAVITGLRDASALVYVAAFVPDVGESCSSLGGTEALMNSSVRAHPSGGTYIPANMAGELFYGDCEVAAADRAARLLVPQASGHGRGRVDHAAWKHHNSRYIVCGHDRAVSPDLQRQMATRCASNEEISASHSPYISQPALIAEAIIGMNH